MKTTTSKRSFTLAVGVNYMKQDCKADRMNVHRFVTIARDVGFGLASYQCTECKGIVKDVPHETKSTVARAPKHFVGVTRKDAARRLLYTVNRGRTGDHEFNQPRQRRTSNRSPFVITHKMRDLLAGTVDEKRGCHLLSNHVVDHRGVPIPISATITTTEARHLIKCLAAKDSPAFKTCRAAALTTAKAIVMHAKDVVPDRIAAGLVANISFYSRCAIAVAA